MDLPYKKIDKSNMAQMILDFPNQVREGFKISKVIKIKGHFDQITVSGMGASIWPAEILRDWIKINCFFDINKGYYLPQQISKNSLNIFISYSGNTEECLSAFKQALEEKMVCLVITSGGKLKQICHQNNVDCITVPSNLVPRMSTGYIFTILFNLLLKTKKIEDKSLEILEAAEKLNTLELNKIGEKIALEINNKIPIIYVSDKLKSLAYIWKIKFNENSKRPAFYHYFPELNHNELEGMVAWHNKNQFLFIFLKDQDSHPQIDKRINITKNFLAQAKFLTKTVELFGENLIQKIFYSLILSDWTSYYLALQHNIDPLPVKIIEEFKQKL